MAMRGGVRFVLPDHPYDNADEGFWPEVNALSPAGDVNGDGVPDLLAWKTDLVEVGDAYMPTGVVWFGHDWISPSVYRLDLWAPEYPAEALPAMVEETVWDSGLGTFWVSALTSQTGDVDGDGVPDRAGWTQGSSYEHLLNGNETFGVSYVVFGAAGSDVDEPDLDGTNGYRFVGGLPGKETQIVPDVNGDGFDEIVVNSFFRFASQSIIEPENEEGIELSFLIHGGPAHLAALDRIDGATDGSIDLGDLQPILEEDGWLGAANLPRELGSLHAIFADPDGERVATAGMFDVYALYGSDAADILIAHNEDVGVKGLGGDDYILTGDSDNTAMGGDGHDVIKTAGGADCVGGGAGNDIALSGEGDDTMLGDSGDDTLKASLGADSVEGGDGNDWISGWRGDDVVLGGDGDDVLRGDFDADTIEGGAGDDRIVAGPGYDVIVFRAGFDEDRVLDFRKYSDKLDFTEHDGLADLADLSIRQVGAHTVIDDGAGGRIVLAEFDAGLLSAGDFLF